MKLKAHVGRGATPTSLRVVPGEDTSFRALERAVQLAGIEATAVRGAKQLHIAVADLARLQEAMAGWELDLDAQVRQTLDHACERREALRRAREVVESVTRPNVAEDLLTDFEDRKRLDPHQVQAVAAITHPDMGGICVFDEQGLGKTVTALFAFHCLRLRGEVTRMVVVAPKNMVLEWARDTERFFGRQYTVEVVVGAEREKRATLDRPADIYVTNFETTISLEVKLRNLLRGERGKALLVVDESFFVKSSEALRTRAVRGLRREVARCIVLCGTPAPNSPQDLVEQFNIADGGTTFEGIRLPPEREAARPVVQQCIETRGVYLRRLKQEVLPDLPTKTFNRVLVPLQPEQEKAYAAAVQRLVRDLCAIDDVTFKKRITSFLAQRVALLQICSNPVAVIDGYTETPAKLVALDAVLEELVVRRREKVVLWSFFTASLEAIVRRYERYNPVRCDGAVARAEDRREAVRKFQEDDTTMLFVGNPAAAGAGITLHRARYAVYESMSNQAAHYLQSLDRIHRRGQTRAVEYLVLMCDRTVELREYDRLIAKEAAAQNLLGDQVQPPVTRLAMLRDAVEAAQLLGVPTDGAGAVANAG